MATAKKQRTSKIASILPAPVLVEQVEQTAPIEAPAPAEVRGLGVGKLAKELIAQGLDNKTILAAIKEQLPNASTSVACISWYRSAMKKAAAKT